MSEHPDITLNEAIELLVSGDEEDSGIWRNFSPEPKVLGEK